MPAVFDPNRIDLPFEAADESTVSVKKGIQTVIRLSNHLRSWIHISNSHVGQLKLTYGPEKVRFVRLVIRIP